MISQAENKQKKKYHTPIFSFEMNKHFLLKETLFWGCTGAIASVGVETLSLSAAGTQGRGWVRSAGLGGPAGPQGPKQP